MTFATATSFPQRACLWLLALVLFALPAGARAQHGGDNTSPELDCEDARSQFAMNRCSRRAFDRADSTLNAVYRSTMAALPAGPQRRLRKAQRAWVAYKEAHCAAAHEGSRRGSIHPLMVNTCLTALTKERTRLLRATY